MSGARWQEHKEVIYEDINSLKYGYDASTTPIPSQPLGEI